jgi:PKD repeat protein
MSIFYDDGVIKRLHLELSNACNSKCPLCPRTGTPVVGNSGIKNLTLDDIKKINFKNLEFMLLCGNFGDPMLCPEIYEICDYIIEKGVDISIKTNGGMYDKKFWYDFGKLLSKKSHYCDSKITFDIDGLEDTNHIYRVGTDFNKIKENVQSFIDGGGHAVWQYMIFKHNEHQVQEAGDMAMQMGFKKFEIKKPSDRGRYKKEKYKHLIKDIELKYTEKVFDIEGNEYDFNKWVHTKQKTPVACKGSTQKELFISCEGDVFPCCWWGTAYMESKYDNNENMISTLTNFDNNIRTNSWDNIVEQYYLKRDEMKTLFKYGCVRECNKQCGNKRKSETYRKIILFDRYQSTV